MSEWRPGVTVYIDAAVLDAIDELRGARTRSEWIRRAVQEALAKEEATTVREVWRPRPKG